MRAGSTFAVDIEMKLATVAETVTVHAESPMIETLKSTTSYTITGELFRAAPVTARSVFTDTLDMLPGIGSGQANDGSGVRIYYFMGSSQWGGFTALDGAPFTSFGNFAPARSSMSTETVGDVEVRAGGAEAYTPLTTGIYMNIVSPRGGNTFKGGASLTYMPLEVEWRQQQRRSDSRRVSQSRIDPASRPVPWRSHPGQPGAGSSHRTATPATRMASAGPRATWRTCRRSGPTSRRSTIRGERRSVHQGDEPTDDEARAVGLLPLRPDAVHRRIRTTTPIRSRSSRVAGRSTTRRWNSAWNNPHRVAGVGVLQQQGPELGGHVRRPEGVWSSGPHPQRRLHVERYPDGNRRAGSTRTTRRRSTCSRRSFIIVRADVTFFKDQWAGSHEFKTGFFGAPRSNRDQTYRAVNDGFILEEQRQIDPANPAAGLIWFHRQTVSPATIRNIGVRDRDYGIYFQDTWKPIERISINAGVRADFIRRWDDVLGFERMSTDGGRAQVRTLLSCDQGRQERRPLLRRPHARTDGR